MSAAIQPYKLLVHEMVYETLAGSNRAERAALFRFFRRLGNNPFMPHDHQETVENFPLVFKLVGPRLFLYRVDHVLREIRVLMTAMRIEPDTGNVAGGPRPADAPIHRSPTTHAAFPTKHKAGKEDAKE